ncbi:MAG: ABC transporter ATP-binding protein [Ignavibacteriaceae bacterium]|nr:ABC transporter ATP-binding protein [Ignavibacteriaceae bacterium]
MLKLDNLSKSIEVTGAYEIKLLEAINLKFDLTDSSKMFYSVLAPFGGGKTTLLKIIAGIEKPSTGSVQLDGNPYKPELVKIIYIPEQPSSFPWLNVIDNIKAGSSKQKFDDKKIQQIIDLIGLTGYENHFPNNKSLGFRFRVSLGRALVNNPSIILLDDCFKSMNGDTQNEIYELIEKLREYDCRFILTTTNLIEAIRLSDQIILMKKNPGKIFGEVEIKFSNIENRLNHKSEEFLSLKKLIEDKLSSEQVIRTVHLSV